MNEHHGLPIGTLLNDKKYEVVQVIGSGGFGIVYKVKFLKKYDLRIPEGEYLAIKELFISDYSERTTNNSVNSTFSEEKLSKYQKQFLDEGRLMLKLDHPNIITVYEVFEANNTLYLVMEFIAGKTLYDHTLLKSPKDTESIQPQKGRMMPEQEALHYIHQIGLALIRSHQHNILHRDVKPQNIMITPQGKAILIDFGIAREFVINAEQTQTVMLSKGFAPPEQYHEKTTRGSFSDVYALSATLYYLVTGRTPVPSSIRSFTELPPPNAFNPKVSSEVNQAIVKGLTIQPNKRFQNIEAFLNALGFEVQLPPKPEPEPEPPQDPPPPEPPKRPKKRKKLLYYSLVALLVIIIGGSLIGYNYMNQMKAKAKSQLINFYSSMALGAMDSLNYDKAYLYYDSLANLEDYSNLEIYNIYSNKARQFLEHDNVDSARRYYAMALTFAPDSSESMKSTLKLLKPPFLDKDSLNIMYQKHGKNFYKNFTNASGYGLSYIARDANKLFSSYTKIPHETKYLYYPFDIESFNLDPIENFTRYNVHDSTVSLSKSSEFSMVRPKEEFIHYNPQMLKWLILHMIPEPNEVFYNDITFQTAYNKKFHTLARDLVISYQYLNKNKNFFQDEVDQLIEVMNTSNKETISYYPYQRYGTSYDYYIDSEKSYNLIHFWLRRGIDGTNDIIWDGLVKIMNMYDKEWFDKQNVQIPK